MTQQSGRVSQWRFLHRPAGWLVSILTLPVAFFAILLVVAQVWDIIREFYCRRFHESSPLLCHFVGEDFRVDLMCLTFVLMLAYPVVHLSWLRRLSQRTHFLYVVSFALMATLVRFLATRVTGTPEAWMR